MDMMSCSSPPSKSACTKCVKHGVHHRSFPSSMNCTPACISPWIPRKLRISVRCSSSPSAIICSIMSQRFWVNTKSEEHTSELQSRGHLVCRLLLEKKKTTDTQPDGTPG